MVNIFSLNLVVVILNCLSSCPSSIINKSEWSVSANEELRDVPEFVKIKAGSFIMGADLPEDFITAEKGIFIQDEFPSRKVSITYDFEISKYEITNSQYELWDPGHKQLRGKAWGISDQDNEAAVYITWDDAVNYCQWLSSKDKKFVYRLPTEAEWEYACRAGTRTPYNDGIEGNIYDLKPLGKLADDERIISEWLITRGNKTTNNIAWGTLEKVDLTVGREGPNKWGVYDMMGNVQEWCQDWYGPYNINDTVNPSGYADGEFKVVRGGSHSIYIQTLRSSNRLAAPRNDSHFMLGLRIVRVPRALKLPEPHMRQIQKKWARDVSQTKFEWSKDNDSPFFNLQSLYDIASEYGSKELEKQFKIPLYTHNHSPAVTWCDNGDILLIWFTGESEKGQELTIDALRGRRNRISGEIEWDKEVSEFYKAADRNMHGSQLWNNAERVARGFKEPFTLYHINGISTDGKWGRLAETFRMSTDFGKTWSVPVIIKKGTDSFHLSGDRNQPQGNAFTMKDGTLISFSDGGPEGGPGSSVNLSSDGGATWTVSTVKNGPVGIHSCGAELNDGSIITFSRDAGKTYGSLPMSASADKGKSFTSRGSQFPGIGTVQRLVLLRLEFSDPHLDPDGTGRKPILLISFSDGKVEGKDATGQVNKINGTFAALSWDEGNTWPVIRVMSDVKTGDKIYTAGPWNKEFTLNATTGQPSAYWAATQSPDGKIYLTDSRLMYTFNLAWLMNGF